MSAADHLKSALASIDWARNVSECVGAQSADLARLAVSAHELAVIVSGLASAEPGNPALSFLAETQAQVHYVAVLIPLALYKPAAASMRSVYESILYYSYFRTHSSELATLVREPKYWASKADILDYHKVHTPGFKSRQEKWGLIARCEEWYSAISAIIHGQRPGKWVTHTELAKLGPVPDTARAAVDEFVKATELVRHFLLCTMEGGRWLAMSKDVRQVFLSGVPGDIKGVLGLSLL